MGKFFIFQFIRVHLCNLWLNSFHSDSQTCISEASCSTLTGLLR